MHKEFDGQAMQEAMRLAGSEAGQQLLSMLRSQHSDAVGAAMRSAKEGDIEKSKQLLSSLLADPKTQALLRQLQEDRNG